MNCGTKRSSSGARLAVSTTPATSAPSSGPCDDRRPGPAMTVPDLLGRRALNRTTLARQLLLGRACLPVPGALEHLVGLQAQAPDAPYVGLWSRLDEFRTTALAGAV